MEPATVQTVAVTELNIRSSCSSRITFNVDDLLPLLFLLQMKMNAIAMLKATAAIYVLMYKEVTIVSVQMDFKCQKTTRLVDVRKVFRSRITGPFVWVSSISFFPVVSYFGFIRPKRTYY